MTKRLTSAAAGLSLGVALAIRFAARRPLFEPGGGADFPRLVAEVPSPLLLVVLPALGAMLGWLVGRTRAEVMTPFLLTALSAAVYVPLVFEIAPFTALFAGAALDFLIVFAGVMAVWRYFELSGRASSSLGRLRAGLLVGIVTWVGYSVLGLQLFERVGFSGDEPHYLLIAHSLLEDGDLRVQNNYFEEDHRLFYLGKIGPHLAAGTEYSIHGVGLPLLLAPGYGALGVVGVFVSLAALSALLTVALFLATRQVAGDDGSAALASAAFALSSPALFLAVSVYPELPAAVVVALTTLALLSEAPPRLYWTVLLAALVGALPFFHMKFLPLAAVLFVALGLRQKRLVPVAAVAAASGVALASFFYATTGSWNPTDAYGRQRIFVERIPEGLAGLFFDQEFGLLLAAPFYLVGLAGVFGLLRTRRWLGLFALAVLAAVALPGAAHPLWSGGNSVPARFLFPALPLLALGAGASRAFAPSRGLNAWLPSLALLSLCASAFILVLPGQPLYLNQRDGTGQLFEALSGSWDLTSYLPSVVEGDVRSWVCAGALAALLALAVTAELRGLAFRAPPLWTVLLAFFWVQDLTGVTPSRRYEPRWVSGLAHDIARNEAKSFVTRPGGERLSRDALLAQMALPLERLVDDGDPKHWWSRAYSIPAGRYRLEGVEPSGWAPCHDQACFDVPGPETVFASSVALPRFRVRARAILSLTPELRFESVEGDRPRAEATLALASGRRLHGLDEAAYLDRRGFWVKTGARAAFVLEPGGVITLSNGGLQNTVEVETVQESHRFDLAPWAQVRVSVPETSPPRPFTVKSSSGFRPVELDPGSEDRRELGVFVSEPRL